MTLFTVGVDPYANPTYPGHYNHWRFTGASRLASVLYNDEASGFIYEAGTNETPSSGGGNGKQSYPLAALPVMITQVYTVRIEWIIRWMDDEGFGGAPQSVAVRAFEVRPDDSLEFGPATYPNQFWNSGGWTFSWASQPPATAQSQLMATQYGAEWYTGEGAVQILHIFFVVDAEPYTGGGFRAMIMQYLLPVFGGGLLGASLDVGHAAGLARLLARTTRGRIRVQADELARLATEAGALCRFSGRSMVLLGAA